MVKGHHEFYGEYEHCEANEMRILVATGGITELHSRRAT